MSLEIQSKRPPQSKKQEFAHSVISLFAGCGGMDLGLQGGFKFLGNYFDPTGFKVIWANELSPSACKTYKQNLGEHIVCGDIKEQIAFLPSYADVIIGGFPCQDISINGKMQGIKGTRSSLYSYIVKAVRKVQPKAFIAENVGSLLLKQHKSSLETILADFNALGYNVSYHLYHTQFYGVPQTRSRVIFVGTAKHLPTFIPPAAHTSDLITAKDALCDLESLAQDKAFAHIWSNAKPTKAQGNRRLIADRPGYTIRAECHGNSHFHYSLPRRLSMREAARIQSFPDDFSFPCGIRETERQIGNAVPPVLAWHIAQAMKKVLEND